MKWGMFLGLILFGFQAMAGEGPKPTLAEVMSPPNYLKRTEPVFNIALIYYGTERNEVDLIRIQALLEKRFLLATDSLIRLNTVLIKQLPYRTRIQDHPEYHLPNITDPARLQRLWYYDFVGAKVLQEVYEVTKAVLPLEKIDAIATISGAQFDGMGFASGRVAITESPREIAWGLPDGGRTDEPSDGQVVDELIHELGHTMFLDHAASQCFQSGMSYEQSRACCAQSLARDDVMSYCRDRSKVNDTDWFYGFKECNLRILKNKVIPAMLSGGSWNLSNREKCL